MSTLPVYLTTLSITTRTTAKNDRIISEYWIEKDTDISGFNVLRYSLSYRDEYKEQQLLSRRIFEPKPSDLKSSVKPHQSCNEITVTNHSTGIVRVLFNIANTNVC